MDSVVITAADWIRDFLRLIDLMLVWCEVCILFFFTYLIDLIAGKSVQQIVINDAYLNRKVEEFLMARRVE